MDLGKINAGLTRVKLQEINGWLHIRGIFPPKPGESEPKQRRIATHCKNNPAGLKKARLMALDIESQLITGSFVWESRKIDSRTIADWVRDFEQDYFRNRARTPNSENNWKKEYQASFNKLPGASVLAEKVLVKAILETEAESRTRVRVCQAFTKLAQFAGLPLNFSEYATGYNAAALDTRALPTDSEILAARDGIQSEIWRNAFEIMAIYGCRNHEVFYIDWDLFRESGDKKLWLLRGKTGERLLYPIQGKDWDFNPYGKPLPDLNLENRSHNSVGEYASKYLGRLIPFKPYDLRHCWARRAFEAGLPPDFCAKAMGHSLTVHLKIYRRFWGDEPYKKMFDRVLGQHS